jgi:hypothetical protein
MRKLKQLYEILWQEIKDKEVIYSLCDEIDKICSIDERKLIIPHFKSQKRLHPEFMTEERNWDKGGFFWWTEEEDENPVNRKAFIKKIISTLN